jgi:type IV pilus assembly protein PilA
MITRMNAAMYRRRDELEQNDKGFTLVELLVVVLIIGILAAIAIPFFLNQRQGAWESQVRSDIANAIIAAETYSVNENGDFTGMDVDALNGLGYNATPDVTLAITAADEEHYVFSVTHASLTGAWVYDSSVGRTVDPSGEEEPVEP